MTRDDIITMAREAGYHANVLPITEVFARFAALVAAKEREACISAIRLVQQAYDKRAGGANVEGSVCSDCIGAIRARTGGTI